MRPVLHVPAHPLRLVRFGLPAAAPGDGAGQGVPHARGPGAVRRRRRARVQPAEPAHELVGGHGADLRLPPLRLAGRAGRLARDHRRARGRGPRARRPDRDRAPGHRRWTSSTPPDVIGAGPGTAWRWPTWPAPRLPRRVATGLPPLPPRPGRVQGRPGRGGRRALDRRAGPAGRHRARDRLVRRDGGRRARGGTRADARAPVRAGGPAVPGRPRPRSSGDTHPVWAYAHVPSGYDGDATEAVIGQLERFAPGLRERIVASTPARPPSWRPTTPTTWAATSSPAPTPRGRRVSGPRLALRSVRDRDPRGLHLLRGHAPGCGSARDERLQRRNVGPAHARARLTAQGRPPTRR